MKKQQLINSLRKVYLRMLRNNIWFDYLKEKILESKDVLNKLYDLDNKVYATNYNHEDLIKFIDNNYDKIFFNTNSDNTTFLLEGSSNTFISVISDYYNKNIELIINDDNYAVNKWIYNIYEEFCNNYTLDNMINITIDYHFKVNNKNVVVIGSNAFITEMKMCLKDNKIISYEYEE